MDEPTAALTSVEVERLFEVVRTLRARRRRGAVHLAPARGGLRHLPAGHDHARRPASSAPPRSRTSTVDDIIRSMVGRDLDALFPKTDTAPGEVVLEVERPHPARASSTTSPSRSAAGRSSRWPGWSAPAAARSPGRSSASTATTPGAVRSTASRCRAARRAPRWRPGMALGARGPPPAGPGHGPGDRPATSRSPSLQQPAARAV